ncbi:hypothetical protein BaRGS_00036170 [Batillaria attramentaria]|uniref:Integral membrane protein 2 n=1 Tax=Batillaria attramentaria TaxID=370345 RepID=A0ABD0JCS0_9CAEN
MTIYTKPTGEKKSEKAPDASKEPLTGKDDADCEEGAPKVVRVTYSPRHRRTWVNLCLILTALLVLGTGIIAAIFLYRHLSSKVIRGRCGVEFYDEIYQRERDQNPADPQMLSDEQHTVDTEYLEEDVEVSEVELYERFTVPKFDEVEETVVWHDFDKNLTAIVDPTHHTCYVMPLNRTRIAPPHDLIDLIMKLKTRYYMPKASVVREEYRVVLPPLSDLTVLGSYIMRECYFYYTFRLEKYVSGVYKRSVDQGAPAMEEAGHYAFIAYTPGHHELFKFTIFKEQEKKDQ